jgi:glycosyltransferase involved in cell wall biosynthesis
MAKIGIITAKAPSLFNVSSDIATVYNELNHPTRIFTRQIQYYEARQLYDKSIIFMPFDPAYITPYIIMFRDYRKAKIDTAFYTTIEGNPIKHLTADWVKRDAELIAVSNYVKEKLEGAELNVIDVIPHGLDLKLFDKVIPDTDKVRMMTGGSVVFGTVASSHRRKGLDLLAKAISLVQDKINAGFYILTEPASQQYFTNLKNVYVDIRFGKLDRISVLKLISSFNFYICSSLSEGFGLPLLEAQAFGVPVIYPDYAPLNEFMNPKINFPYEWVDIELYRERLGIEFELHIYNPESLADKIIEAYNMFTSNGDEYKRRIGEARKYVYENFDMRKIYIKFNRHLNL